MELLSNNAFNKVICSTEFNNGVGWITVFTPTFNRAKFLERPYNSFLQQTNKRRIWLLVDDGSADNTKEVSKELLEKEEMPMLFISQANGGKHSAFKAALAETQTEFFLCADDDDSYNEDAIDVFLREWDKIKQENKSNIGAIRALTQYEDGRFAANFEIPNDVLGSHCDISTLDMIYQEKKLMENWTCYRVSALRSINIFDSVSFRDYKQKFFLESIWQNRFARVYKCRFLFVPLRYYYLDSGESLSRRKETKQKYYDDFINSFCVLTENFDYILKFTPLKKWLREAVILSIMRHRLNIPLWDFIKKTKNFYLSLLFICLCPIGLMTSRYKIPNF